MRSPSLQSVEAEPLPVASTDSVTTGVPSARVLRNYEVSLFGELRPSLWARISRLYYLKERMSLSWTSVTDAADCIGAQML